MQANVREAARDYRKLTAVSKELAQREAQLESRGWVRPERGPRLRPGALLPITQAVYLPGPVGRRPCPASPSPPARR